ncbi:RlpA-like double-psi beta-barrel-protein domain-containing protein-containing protein [Mycena epipterygia]|nr:RlpA-like double-psi beta-barrel-protein domain-containing protein-containing protein [Mycena epipterygia]
MLFLFVLLCFVFQVQAGSPWIDYPADGTATMTHYTIPDGFIAACGCTGDSTKYPTAAMSQLAYGSSTAFGPACGKCFNLTLLNTYTPDPPFFPNVVKSIVIKVTDLCPLSATGWCSGTPTKKNPGGQYINFDLAYPSAAIPDDFFPTVDCLPDWAGAKNPAALGSVANMGNESVCCPANPTGSPNDTCPSYSDDNSLPPDTTTSYAQMLVIPSTLVSIFVFTQIFRL